MFKFRFALNVLVVWPSAVESTRTQQESDSQKLNRQLAVD